MKVPFNDVEPTFSDVERTFNVAERNFLLGKSNVFKRQFGRRDEILCLFNYFARQPLQSRVMMIAPHHNSSHT